MDIKTTKWNKTNYQKFIKYLKSNSEIEYRKFNQKIIANKNIKIIGIRVPKLKEIAKEISKGNYIEFIKYNTHKYYEENTLHGLILGYIKIDETGLLKMLDQFIPFIDNWSTCDTVCANLKQFKKIDINKINKYLNSSNPWSVRVGLVLLLDHYIKKDNLNYIFNACNSIKLDDYYVKMALAWLISICYIKCPENTLKYLKNNNIDKFTLNKTISKICDSHRISKLNKEKLKKIKV